MSDPLDVVASWPVDRAAVGVTSVDSPLATVGGSADVFPLASVTKPLAAYAVLVAVQDGLVHLDEPAGPGGATVRHLLAHASGLPPDEGGQVIQPERRRIYSNWGFELLGALLEERTSTRFDAHLRLEVLEPLGMSDTTLEGSPARDARGTVADLLSFGRELLSPAVLDEELLGQATSVQFPGLAGVLPGYGRQDPNDWGLGFEIRNGKSPHWTGSTNSPATFGHFGQSGSFLWVDPQAGLACAAVGDRAFGDWAIEAWPQLSDAIMASYG